MPQVDIVMPARNEGALLEATLRSLAVTPAGVDFGVIVVDDGSLPPVAPTRVRNLPLRVIRTSGEGAAAARNRGAAAGSAPILCFCDAHMGFTPGWLGRLVPALGAFDAVCPGIAAMDRPASCGYGFTWGPRYDVQWLPRPPAPQEVPFLPGACLCLARETFARVGGFDGLLVPWGYEDVEISLALWLTGARCGVEPAAVVAHHFRHRHPYFVLQGEVERNLLRVGVLHFGPPRLRRLAAYLHADLRLTGEVRAAAEPRRRRLLARRRRDDDWFCDHFGLPV